MPSAFTASATANAAGVATINYSAPIGPGDSVEITQISIKTNSIASPVYCNVYVNGAFVCGSGSGNQDSASESGAPIMLTQVDTLKVEWVGLNPGDTASLYFSYR